MNLKKYRWYIVLSTMLIILSAGLYILHFIIFEDPHHIFIYLLGDIAFIPLEVLVVTIIIHQLLSHRERKVLLEKLNMLIGTFFSEVGTTLLILISDYDPKLEDIKQSLIVTQQWTDDMFSEAERKLKAHNYQIDINQLPLSTLKQILVSKRDFLVQLLENPILLEHESFTQLLRAVFHLTEELAFRKDFSVLPDSDLNHLAQDIKRFYVLIAHEWLDYMWYLKDNYPYLFSLAMRTNPFDETASPVVV